MKATAYDFASLVDRQIEALPDDAYHRRLDRTKRLIEEFYPLSRLALHFKQPGLDVEVEGFEDDGRSDGFIWTRGFEKREFEVEITYADYSYDEALRAELLVSEGSCPGAGEIRRDKKSGAIIAKMEAVDHGEHIGRIALAVVGRLRDKATKPYEQGTVLLIAFSEVKLYGRSDWNQVLSAVREEAKKAAGPFSGIYLFNGATNELRQAARYRPTSPATDALRWQAPPPGNLAPVLPEAVMVGSGASTGATTATQTRCTGFAGRR